MDRFYDGEMQPSQTAQGPRPARPQESGPDRPVVAFVLTLLGAFFYLPYGIGFSIGYSGGTVPFQFAVILVSSLGVIFCGLMMMLWPRRHLVFGVLVLLISAFAIAVDGYVLVNILTGGFVGASNYVGATGVAIGMALAAAIFVGPLVLIILGGILAIKWKLPSSDLESPK